MKKMKLVGGLHTIVNKSNGMRITYVARVNRLRHSSNGNAHYTIELDRGSDVVKAEYHPYLGFRVCGVYTPPKNDSGEHPQFKPVEDSAVEHLKRELADIFDV